MTTSQRWAEALCAVHAYFCESATEGRLRLFQAVNAQYAHIWQPAPCSTDFNVVNR